MERNCLERPLLRKAKYTYSASPDELTKAPRPLQYAAKRDYWDEVDLSAYKKMKGKMFKAIEEPIQAYYLKKDDPGSKNPRDRHDIPNYLLQESKEETPDDQLSQVPYPGGVKPIVPEVEAPPNNILFVQKGKRDEEKGGKKRKDQHHDSTQMGMAMNSTYPGVYGAAPTLSQVPDSDDFCQSFRKQSK